MKKATVLSLTLFLMLSACATSQAMMKQALQSLSPALQRALLVSPSHHSAFITRYTSVHGSNALKFNVARALLVGSLHKALEESEANGTDDDSYDELADIMETVNLSAE